MRRAVSSLCVCAAFLAACAGRASDGAENADAREPVEIRPAAAMSAGGCGTGGAELIERATPLEPGPLKLDGVHCLPLPPSPYSTTPPALSPDGERYFVYDGIRGLYVGAIGDPSPPRHAGDRVTIAGLGDDENLSFAWAADSKSLFSVRQDTARPSGFALGPLVPLVVPVDRPDRALPPLTHPAGTLDRLYWVGGSGLALAEFGTRGSFYRPEHDDPRPTLALVDARRGRILESVAVPGLPGLGRGPMLLDLAARLDSRGRINSVLRAYPDQWFEWRQGRGLRRLPIALTGRKPFAVSPDGSAFLVMHNLTATGIILERRPSPPPEPATGTIAELLDLDTGRVRWRLEGRATDFSRSLKPAISPDGRYALVTMPPDGERGETTALVAMADGRILQRVGHLWTGENAVRFAADGKTVWITGGRYASRYRLER